MRGDSFTEALDAELMDLEWKAVPLPPWRGGDNFCWKAKLTLEGRAAEWWRVYTVLLTEGGEGFERMWLLGHNGLIIRSWVPPRAVFQHLLKTVGWHL